MAVEISQKYDINLFPIETILSWITSKEIGIPEIQRPFVWEPNQVKVLKQRRKLMAEKIKEYYYNL